MTRPDISVRSVGVERQPLVVIDGFSRDPDALRAAAIVERFGPAGHHYPGIRAPVPGDYFTERGPVLAQVLAEVFGHRGRVDVLDASFSVVTTPPAELSVQQRLPHCDAFAGNRLAILHYLSPEGGDGTAFFRHRSTGFETVDETRAPVYFDRLNAELRDGDAPTGYIAGDTPLFERMMLAEARYDRALIYRSFLLHSGAIASDAALSPDPATGRLTVTAFLVAT